jgi:hypothetical protein
MGSMTVKKNNGFGRRFVINLEDMIEQGGSVAAVIRKQESFR